MSESIPTTRRTISNLLAVWGNRVLGILAMLITTPLILHHFGMEVTGVWLMITVLVSHLSLLDSGVSNVLVRFLAAQKARKNSDKGSHYLTTTFYLLLAVGIMLLATSPILVTWFMQTLQVDSSMMLGAQESVWLAIFFIAISLPLRVGHGLLSSIHQIDKLNMFVSLSIAVRILLIVGVFQYFEPNLVHLALIVFGSTLLGTVMVFISGIRNNRELSLKVSYFSVTELRDLLSLGGSALIVTLSALLMTQSATLITGYVLGPDYVPVIAYPLLIFTALTPFMAALQTLLTPVAAALSAKQEKQQILPIYQMAVRYQSAAAIFLLLVFFAFGEVLIVKWLSGPKISAETLTIIANSVLILLAGFVFSSVAFIGRSVLTSVGKHWPSATIELVTALIGLLSGYLLMRFTEIGLYGIAVGVALTLVIRGIVFYPYLIGRYFGMPPVDIIIHGLGITVALGFISFFIPIVAFFVIVRDTHPDFLTWFAIAKVLSIFLWCLLTWHFLVERKHKIMMVNKVAMYRTKLRGVACKKR